MKREIYLNEKQLAFVGAPQKVKTFVGGRGSGKSSVNGVISYLNVTELPRSKGFILGLTYKQILDFILPEMIQMWGRFGLKEDLGRKQRGHFVIGRKPPEDWERPYSPVKDYSTCISFFNGSIIQLISFDRKDNSRGGSYDWGMFDEAALLNYDRLKREILPSIRGNIYKFRKKDRLHSKVFTTSMPWEPSGMWVPDMAEDAIAYPKKVFYIESTAHDNRHVLGEDYLEEAERSTDYYTFQVEYMNQRIGKMPNSFYDSFDPNKHCYVAFKYEHNEDDWRKTKVIYSDYKEDKELDLSFDFGGNFNCMLVAQDYIKENNEVKILRNLYVKNERKLLDNLIDDFCNKYADHKKKVVNIYGDRNGNNKQPNSLTLYQQIENKLRKRGWSCCLKVEGLDALHAKKQIKINELLSESDPRTPKIRINKLECKELIISIQSAGITAEFKKDKRSERQNIPQEKATHLSDAFDNYIGPKLSSYVASRGTPMKVFFGS